MPVPHVKVARVSLSPVTKQLTILRGDSIVIDSTMAWIVRISEPRFTRLMETDPGLLFLLEWEARHGLRIPPGTVVEGLQIVGQTYDCVYINKSDGSEREWVGEYHPVLDDGCRIAALLHVIQEAFDGRVIT